MPTSTKPKKQKTVAKLKAEAATLMQKLVRMKSANEDGMCQCVTCGKTQHFTEMDGGHFITRKSNATLLLEENIHPQCKRCNKYEHGALDDYTLFMIDTYGMEKVEELVKAKRQIKKFNRIELEDLKIKLRGLIREQEVRLNIR